ncbi:hypothetical protein JCM9957A_25440 [Kineosporia succinea]
MYLVSASLTALVLAAGGTAAVAVNQSKPQSTTTQDEAATVAYKRSAYPASDGTTHKIVKKKKKKKRPTSTASPSATATPEATPSTTASASPEATTPEETATTQPVPAGTVFAGAKKTENWTSTVSELYTNYARGGSTVKGGVSDPGATDGKALNLTIPAGAGASPSNAAEVASKQEFTYGSFTSRVKTADCSAAPNTGAVTGIFTYGNDGTDQDGDGLTDNSEIDIEVLCARPDVLNLTIYTDYEASTEKSQRVSRIVDLKAGKVISTCYYTDFSGECKEVLSGGQASPATVPVVKDFDSSKSYNDYTIDWAEDGVSFKLKTTDGQEISLWDYQGPAERIPNRPASFLVNFWHTNSWPAEGRPNSIQAPTTPLTVAVDSIVTQSLK